MSINKRMVVAIAGTAMLLGGCIPAGNSPRTYSDYDYNQPDPAYGGYEADRYYRDDPNYRERRLTDNDRVYRGRDGRYYCRRDNGTTGLIVGGVAGGILGNIIAPGGSALLGTIIGAVGGGVAGRAIDKSDAKDGMVCK
jgi:outer membrane lipoprotein SlyB